MTDPIKNRRPLAIRNTRFAQKIAAWLSKKAVTPNQISIASIYCALFSLICSVGYFFYPHIIFLFLIIIGIQARLLCNLFYCMVAIEGNKKSDIGELFNDLPDRIADPIIIIGIAIFCHSEIGTIIGWLCALGALLTAYIRVLGVSMNKPACFLGPMAKQHRMALITITLFIMIILQLFTNNTMIRFIPDIMFFIMLIGIIITCIRRIQFIYHS